jgi:1-acyl-sn-glycerol-3-phosphate acyltransferase
LSESAVAGPGRRTLFSRARRGVRAALVVSAFAWFWGGAFLFSWFVLPLVALSGGTNRARRYRACQRVVRASFRLFHGYMRVLTLVDAQVVGTIPRRSGGGPVVLVSNHTTLVDTTAIICAYPHTCALAKAPYTGSVVVGPLLRLVGHISTGTGRWLSTAIERLRDGFDILVFPEGTRSPPKGLGPFHRGAFEIACRADVPVVLLLSSCEPSALTKERAFWDQPDQVAVLSIRPTLLLEPRDFGMDSRALMFHVEEVYTQAIRAGSGSAEPTWSRAKKSSIESRAR